MPQESCNGADDNCNGEVDENVASRPCGQGQGNCQTGIETCENGAWSGLCSGEVPPSDELCDGKDNDCDGAVDEPYGSELQMPCEVGVGACFRRGSRVCSPDGNVTVCDVQPLAPGEEMCNGLDDDCDGRTDERFDGLGSQCTQGQGRCERVGVVQCTPNGEGVRCSVQAGEPRDERCDGQDNDCDGKTDEDFQRADGPDGALGQACTAGTGECAQAGIYVCRNDGAGVRCNARAGEASADICDGLDNDCDASTPDGQADPQRGILRTRRCPALFNYKIRV